MILTHHGRDTGCDPHLPNQDEEGMLYVHRCSGHIQVSHHFHERRPIVPQNNQLASETEKC
jgi:hypothetical protein